MKEYLVYLEGWVTVKADSEIDASVKVNEELLFKIHDLIEKEGIVDDYALGIDDIEED